LTWKLQLDLKNREICDVEFHAESENEIGFRIAFSVLVGNHFEQHAVFMIFGHFSPFLTKIAPLNLTQFKQNFAGTCATMVSNISENFKTIQIA
jgi:hypothetical protein